MKKYFIKREGGKVCMISEVPQGEVVYNVDGSISTIDGVSPEILNEDAEEVVIFKNPPLSYAEKRRREYPLTGDQLDAIFKERSQQQVFLEEADNLLQNSKDVAQLKIVLKRIIKAFRPMHDEVSEIDKKIKKIKRKYKKNA